MLAIFNKELSQFFHSITGVAIISVFYLIMGFLLWVSIDTSIFQYGFAELRSYFDLAPIIFMFLTPAFTMQAFSDELSNNTIQFLKSKPLTEWQLVMGKYFALCVLSLLIVLPTLIYFYSIWKLAMPSGSVDTGSIIGSYIGLFLLMSSFVAISLFASSLTKNTLAAFALGTFLCFILYFGFNLFSRLPIFIGKADLFLQYLGIDFHYAEISKGVIQFKDILYFLSVNVLFLFGSYFVIKNKSI